MFLLFYINIFIFNECAIVDVKLVIKYAVTFVAIPR